MSWYSDIDRWFQQYEDGSADSTLVEQLQRLNTEQKNYLLSKFATSQGIRTPSLPPGVPLWGGSTPDIGGFQGDGGERNPPTDNGGGLIPGTPLDDYGLIDKPDQFFQGGSDLLQESWSSILDNWKRGVQEGYLNIADAPPAIQQYITPTVETNNPPPAQEEVNKDPVIPDTGGGLPPWRNNADNSQDGWVWYDDDDDPLTPDVFGPPPATPEPPSPPDEPAEEERPDPPDNSGNWRWDDLQKIWVVLSSLPGSGGGSTPPAPTPEEPAGDQQTPGGGGSNPTDPPAVDPPSTPPVTTPTEPPVNQPPVTPPVTQPPVTQPPPVVDPPTPDNPTNPDDDSDKLKDLLDLINLLGDDNVSLIDDILDGLADPSELGGGSNTNTNTNTNEFNFGDMFKDLFSEGTISNVINLGASDAMADAYNDAADKALAFNDRVYTSTRDDLAPYRAAGASVVGTDGRSHLLQSALNKINLDPMALQDIDPAVDVDTGIDPALWEGFEALPEIAGKAGSWEDAGLITRGSDQYNLLVDDAIQQVMNRYTAGGKSNTNMAKDDATRAMLRAVGEIENINSSRLSQEVTKRNSDLGVSKTLRDSEAGEQVAEADRFFAQQTQKREQIWRELFAEEETSIENQFQLDSRDMQRRSQILQELMATDSQFFDKLFQVASLGQNSAARTGATGASLAPTYADIYGATGAVDAGAAGNQFAAANEILKSIFGAA